MFPGPRVGATNAPVLPALSWEGRRARSGVGGQGRGSPARGESRGSVSRLHSRGALHGGCPWRGCCGPRDGVLGL